MQTVFLLTKEVYCVDVGLANEEIKLYYKREDALWYIKNHFKKESNVHIIDKENSIYALGVSSWDLKDDLFLYLEEYNEITGQFDESWIEINYIDFSVVEKDVE